MSKSYFPILALYLATLALLPAQTPPPQPIQLQIMVPNCVQDDLRGHVKSVETTTYKSVDGEKTDLKGKSKQTYNVQGCTLEDSSWDDKGQQVDDSVFTYDAAGNLQQKMDLDYCRMPVGSSAYTFDPKTQTITRDDKAPDGSAKDKTISVYDQWGKEHEVTEYDAAGKMTQRTTLTRNGRGNEVSVIFYGPQNEPKVTISISWNPNGSQRQTTYENHEEGKTVTVDYEYPQVDSHGNWTQQIKKSSLSKADRPLGAYEEINERDIQYY